MSNVKHAQFLRKSKPLFVTQADGKKAGDSWATYLLKNVANPDGRSQDSDNTGEVAHPFNWAAAKAFKNGDPHHSSCIEVKREATVGHGFVKEMIDSKLDPLTTRNWQDTIVSAVEDFWLVGNGFLEIVRKGNKIVGVHHLQAERVKIWVENERNDFHYKIRTKKGRDIRAAHFGDKDGFMSRASVNKGQRAFSMAQELPTEADRVSEIIHLRRPSSLHRWYGMPDWLAAVAQIELAHAITQYNYDFFLNSGVPEFIMVITGTSLGDAWEDEIKPALQAGTGVGNHHSTLALNIAEPEAKLFVEKLGEEMAQGWFESMLETVASRIVSAHRVPPLMAGIQTPGKLGANNEFINAIWMFHALVVKPAQVSIAKTLACTLGSAKGVEGLSGSDFEMKATVDEVPVAQVEAPGSADEPAKAPARSPKNNDASEKVKKALEDRSPDAFGKAFGAILRAYIEATPDAVAA